MKMLLLLSFILFGLTVNAKNYYISNSGNDSNSGTDPSTPWQTINKVNSFKNFAPGDNILFNRGNTFYGSITVSNSGSSGNPITYGAYGTGINPVITGFTAVTSWTNLGGNIWESTNAISTLPYTNMVTINGVNTPMGRYPNKGYLTYQSHSGFTSITSSALTGTPNWAGAEMVIKRNRYTIRIDTITSQSGGTLNYKDHSSNTNSLTDGFGFFIQNDTRTLDTANEWYYNASTKKIDIYSTSSPVNIQVATVQDLFIVSGNQSYITIDGLNFTGANQIAISKNNSGSNFIVRNCNISYSGVNGILLGNTSNCTFNSNTISYSNATAIRLSNNPTNATITNNTVKNSGVYPGMMTEDWVGGAINAIADYCLVQYNNIDSSGYNGITGGGINMQLRNNFINHSCMINDDGGGIYSSGTSSGDNPGKQVIGNIILNSLSDLTGTNAPNDPMGFGIYLDSWSSGVLVQGNTISGCIAAGGFFSNNDSCTIRDNTFYNNSTYPTGFSAESEMQIQYICCNQYNNNNFKNNIAVVTRSSKNALFLYNSVNSVINFGICDSNYYALLTTNTNVVKVRLSSIKNYSLAGWKSYSKLDTHSLGSSKSITSADSLKLVYNATNSPTTTSLPYNYTDVKGNNYNGSITLQPYTSVVLIQNDDLP